MEEGHQFFDITNVRDILTILFKHKYKIIAAFLAISIGATVFAFVFAPPPRYAAKSVIMVKQGREFLSRPEVGDGGRGLSIPAQAIIQSEINILTSRDLIDTVIKSIGLERLFPNLAKALPAHISPGEVAIQAFQESLRVINISGSSLIEVVFTHSDPYVAAAAVNALVDGFKEKHLAVFSGTSTSFLEGQQKLFQERLRESETNLADYRQKNRVFSFEEQRTALITQRSALDTNLKTAQGQISELEQKVALIRSPKWIVDAPELQARVVALQQREAELLSKYVEGSGAIQNVREELQAAKNAIKRGSEEAKQKELYKAEGELTMAKARADTIRRQLAQVEGEILALDARGPELQDLKREAAQQEQSYQTYVRKLEESLIIDDMDRQKMVAITVVEKAVASTMPMKRRFGKRQLVAMGFFGGIGAGIALAFLLEFMAPGMTTPLSAERRLNLPVMVSIPKKN